MYCKRNGCRQINGGFGDLLQPPSAEKGCCVWVWNWDKSEKQEGSNEEGNVFSLQVVHIAIIEPDPPYVAIRVDCLCWWEDCDDDAEQLSIEGGQHLNSIVAKQLGDSGGVVADYNDSYDNKPNVEERVTGTKFWNRHLVHCRSRSQCPDPGWAMLWRCWGKSWTLDEGRRLHGLLWECLHRRWVH